MKSLKIPHKLWKLKNMYRERNFLAFGLHKGANVTYLALPRQIPSGCMVRHPFSPIQVSKSKYFSLVWPSSHWQINWQAASSGWPKQPVMHVNTLMKEQIQIIMWQNSISSCIKNRKYKGYRWFLTIFFFISDSASHWVQYVKN